MKTNRIVRMILMVAIISSPSVFAQQQLDGLEVYAGGKKGQQGQGGLRIYFAEKDDFFNINIAYPYGGIEAGRIKRTAVSGNGTQGFGFGGSIATSYFDSSIGANVYFVRRFGTPGQAVSVMVSPLRLLHIVDNGENASVQVGGQIRMEASAPFSNSIRALLSGSVLKSYGNSDVNFIGQASLECDLSKRASVNLGVCTEAAFRESNSPVTGTKIVQSSTGPMIRAGVSVRLAD